MADGSGDSGRIVRGVATGLGVVSLAMMTAATAALAMHGPEWLLFGSALGFVVFAGAAAIAHVAGWQAEPRDPAVRRERAQWQRWQNCLFTWPLMSTNIALLAVNEMRADAAANSTLPLVLPAFAVSMLLHIMPLTRGPPRSARRQQFEDLVDELSRAHAAVAFRVGYFALMAGATGVLLVALFAPAWTGEAAIAAIWLGFLVPCIRFGLLQRAAED